MNINTYDVIRNKSDENKVAFITNTITEKGIPAHFEPLPNSYERKIFFRRKDGTEEQREWLLYEDNKFFCVYCLCFSLFERHRLISGVNYMKNCKICEILNKHENEAHHIRAKSIFVDKTTKGDSQDRTNQLEKRNVLNTVVKIIIFQASFG